MGKGKDAARAVTGGLTFTVALMSAAGCYFMLRQLVTPWWIPVCVVLAVTVPLALPMRGIWRWLTGSDNVALNLLCHMLSVFPLLLCAALTVNYACANVSGKTEARIEKVYRQTRYRSRRVGRRTYTRGEPYQVYCMEIETSGGLRRDFDISRKIYSKAAKGDTIQLDILSGPLGMKMLDISHPHLPEHAATRRKESRSEKMRRKYREHMDRVLNRRYRHDHDSAANPGPQTL